MKRILRNGRLADGRVVDIAIEFGRIHSVRETADPQRFGSTVGASSASDGWDQAPVHDLTGWLVLPGAAEPHAHLDKALSAEMAPNPAGDLAGAIDAWVGARNDGLLTHGNTVARTTAALERLLVHGVTAVRTHVDVMGQDPIAALRAVKEAATEFEGLMHVQTVALTGSPIVGSAGAANRAGLAAALEEGVDFVGGCPHLEPDGPALIAQAITAATEAGIGIDLHVDETLDRSVLTLREYAIQVIDAGFDGSVSAGHCVSLGMQTEAVQAEVSALVAEAGISVFPLPQTNLFLQGRDHRTAVPRGITAMRALLDHGVLVAAGADNVQDPFNLVGRSDPLETAALLVMAAHQLPTAAYDLVANNPRRALGLAPVNFEAGDPADFLVLDAPSIRAAVADAPMSRRTFRGGNLVASADQQLTIIR